MFEEAKERTGKFLKTTEGKTLGSIASFFIGIPAAVASFITEKSTKLLGTLFDAAFTAFKPIGFAKDAFFEGFNWLSNKISKASNFFKKTAFFAPQIAQEAAKEVMKYTNNSFESVVPGEPIHENKAGITPVSYQKVSGLQQQNEISPHQ